MAGMTEFTIEAFEWPFSLPYEISVPEPKVMAIDVQIILNRVVQPDDPDNGASVSLIAEKANVSTRTVYRALNPKNKTISLDLADRLCLAAGAHLSECRLSWPDGRITTYYEKELIQ